jgi:3-methyl-2-oxobutanoate hydroxymethyltransferase
MSRRNKITIKTLFDLKKRKEKIVMLTAYDYQTAILEDRSGVDIILVGDKAARVPGG